MQALFDLIDWQEPWLAQLRHFAEPITASKDWRCALNEVATQNGLSNHRGQQIKFVPQADLPARMAYEQFISESGCVPTRDNLHDFFNALIWLAFPLVKRQLNALQAGEIARQQAEDSIGIQQVRGAKRDAATLFDENAAAMVVRSDAAGRSIADRLRHHQWTDVFFRDRVSFVANCSILLIGHALIEKLVTPYKAITAHSLILEADDDFFASGADQQMAWVDAVLSAQIQREPFASTLFTPLPVMGVPGWQEKQDLLFYGDEKVFRPQRRNCR